MTQFAGIVLTLLFIALFAAWPIVAAVDAAMFSAMPKGWARVSMAFTIAFVYLLVLAGLISGAIACLF